MFRFKLRRQGLQFLDAASHNYEIIAMCCEQSAQFQSNSGRNAGYQCRLSKSFFPLSHVVPTLLLPLPTLPTFTLLS
jgi:hypothetical protein